MVLLQLWLFQPAADIAVTKLLLEGWKTGLQLTLKTEVMMKSSFLKIRLTEYYSLSKSYNPKQNISEGRFN